MSKKFALSAEQIRPLAVGHGGGIATDRITVDGLPVGYMYRTQPRNSQDSGWAFLAGDETDEYMDDPDNHTVFDINTIANFDPDITPMLESPVGSAFIRTESGFVAIPEGAPEE